MSKFSKLSWGLLALALAGCEVQPSEGLDAGAPIDSGPLQEPLLRIPVVVHIIYPTEASNISREKIEDQLRATNRHFRAQNSEELDSLPAEHRRFAADARIEFYLAQVDPQGTPSNGIQRRHSQMGLPNGIGKEHAHFEQGGLDAWPADRYLNIWVGDSTTRWGELGLPGHATIPGFDDTPMDEWGVQVDYRAFGTLEPVEEGYHQAKTLTHELGHYLGLIGHTRVAVEGGHRHWSCDGKPDTQCKNSQLINSFMTVQEADPTLKMFSISQVEAMRARLLSGPLSSLGDHILGR